MDPLPPIPTPPQHRWREFRIRYVPLIVFVGVLVTAMVLWNEKISPPTMVGEVESIRANVTSPMAGSLTELTVVRLQPVKAGPVVGRVLAADPRMSAHAKILEIGLQLEPISPTLLPPNAAGGGVRHENGLPVLVSLPNELKLLPGEIVDLTVTDH